MMQTSALNVNLPKISINVSTEGKKPGMTLTSYVSHIIPLIFDEYGDIRWYLDFSNHSTLSDFNYNNGMERLQNGNFYFGEGNSATIYEVNMLGEIINTWSISGYELHHHVLEKPNGNFILSVSKQGLATIEDFAIEVDRTTKQIINEWDFRQSLQSGRTTLTDDNSSFVISSNDWLHVNAIEFDETDNTIIVSGRHQGVAKVDANNKVVWIIAPHRGWGQAGDGTDLNTKLLQPLNANNQPITDTLVINGYTNNIDFEWNWYQHAATLTPSGNLFMFDNGDLRNYTASSKYSRAVEYEIDPVNMTIKQVWQYGKARGVDTYSSILSDVDYHADVGHVVFSPGAVQNNGAYGKVVELDYNSSAVLFEATITPPTSYSTFHRTERLSIYP